jgi:chromosome segregation ATPase
LYTVLTGYVIFNNKTIGSTQLGYSALHREQLKLLQDEMAKLSAEVAGIQHEQETSFALDGVRFDGLENRINRVSKALELAETSRQSLAKTSSTQSDNLRQAVGEISSAVAALKTEQGQFGGRLTELQAKLTALTTTLGTIQSQQTQATAALTTQLAQMQKETVQIASSKANLDKVQFLGGLLEAALAKSAQWPQLNEEALPAAVQWWRQSQLLNGAANTEVALADKMRQLGAESARIRGLIVKVLPAAVRRQDEAALKATAKDQAMTAWSEAGELLALYPVLPESASDSALRELTQEHENVRQQLQARAK